VRRQFRASRHEATNAPQHVPFRNDAQRDELARATHARGRYELEDL